MIGWILYSKDAYRMKPTSYEMNRFTDIAGIDLLFDGEHFKVCEANSSPGFEGIEKCCDINIANEIYDFIRYRFGFFD